MRVSEEKAVVCSGIGYFAYRIPGIVATDNGLFACFECRNEDSDWAQIDLKVIKSVDGGESWEDVLYIPGDGSTMNNPTMISDGESLHLLFCRDYSKMYHTVSSDGGKSWSEPSEICGCFKDCSYPYTVLAAGPGHGIKTEVGVLIAPVWLASNFEDPKAHKPSVVTTVYSDDGGVTWKAGEILRSDCLKNPSESALGLLPDGKILISIRNENEAHSRWHAVSSTGYSGWESLKEMPNLPDPICKGALDSKDGMLYFTNCAHRSCRENLTLKVSADGFESFDTIQINDIGGYSDVAVQNGKAYVLYEKTDVWHIDGLYLRSVEL